MTKNAPEQVAHERPTSEGPGQERLSAGETWRALYRYFRPHRWVVDAGRVRASGAREELVAADPLYVELAATQFLATSA
ncbi:MAG: hypothetical protein WCD21_25695 [Streptomyces sp.]